MKDTDPSSPTDLEEVRVRADAREWFAERLSLIAWFWDDDDPRTCQPSLVVRHFETKKAYPSAVRREPPGRMTGLLHDEWRRAGIRPRSLPKLTPWQDGNGRTAWHIDLGGVLEDQRILVGRALIRNPICGTWDPVENEIAYPMSVKIRYLNRFGDVLFDPTDALIARWFEGIDQEEDSGNNLVLLYRNQRSFNAWIEREGFIIEVSAKGAGSLQRLAYPGPDIRVREISVFGNSSEEEFIGQSTATEILMRFLADSGKLPDVPGLIWRKVEPDFDHSQKEDFR